LGTNLRHFDAISDALTLFRDGLPILGTLSLWMVTATADNTESPPLNAATETGVPDFSRVFSEQVRYLWNTLRRLGICESDLEDVAHEVMLHVHAQLPQHDPEQPIRPWIFRLALGAAANYRRLARHRIVLHAAPPEVRDPKVSIDEDLILRERRMLLQQALHQVPLQHRAVLILHDMDEATVPEVAAALGIGLNTAYSRLRLGREAFRKGLERLLARGGFR
jgi:RNA polymerase sigma-70 factor (ECF subfamily)